MPVAKREAAGYLIREHALPIRRACNCVTLSRSAFYRPLADWTVRDAKIIAALAQLVEGRPARGFWKCRKQLRRSRKPWHHKRIYRVYKRMNLHLRRPAKRRLPKRERVALYVLRMPDTVWSADFMSDALICGRRFRTFNVVDDFNREALHIEVDTSISSERLIRVFAQLHRDRGLPQVLRTDNGPNSSVKPSHSGPKWPVWQSSTSSQASPTRMPTLSDSTARYARNCWISICLHASTMSARRSTGG